MDLQTLGDRHEQAVSRFMPKAVFYDLEVVQVCKQHRDLAAPPIGTSQGVFEAVHEQRPVRQSGKQIVERLMLQLLLEGLALGDVPEGDHGACYLAILSDRGARVLDREARAVLPPKHLVVPAMSDPGRKRRVDRTLFAGIGRSVQFRVVNEAVYWS